MNIALIGSGGREHALCQKIFESPLTNKVYCIPGNAGTSKIAQNIDIDIFNFKRVLRFYLVDRQMKLLLLYSQSYLLI